MQILIIGGEAKSLLNFRGPLLRTMIYSGHCVSAAAKCQDSETEKKLAEMGVEFYPIKLSRASINPFFDLLSLIDIIRLISYVRPQIVLSYTIKPVIFSGLTAIFCGFPTYYSLISGLGYTFMESQSFLKQLLGLVARVLYRISLKNSQKVFFQNPDDVALFLEKGLVQSRQTVLVNGSGVDIKHYEFSPLPEESVFLMISRLLVDKGVREYVEAARRVKQKFPQTRFLLVGDLDQNPSSIREKELMKWQKEKYIEYVGYLNDVRPAIRKCRYYVLPSYREGLPRTVLEAMAIGRPIITTDAPGCRETVRLTPEGQRQKERSEAVMRGENGFLVRKRNVEALVKAMLQLLKTHGLAGQMAEYSRKITEEKFDVHKVNSVILNAMGLL